MIRRRATGGHPEYETFLGLLRQRQCGGCTPECSDWRAHFLSRRGEVFGIGFQRKALRNAFSANMPSLFPELCAIDDVDFSEARQFLLFGAALDDPERSHASALRLLRKLRPGDDVTFFEMGFLASSHSWSEAIAAQSRRMACLGYVFDDRAQYYMAGYPNRLTERLNGAVELTAEETARARALMDRIAVARISKYNSQPIRWPAMRPGFARRVLVVDQNHSDASNYYGRADAGTFRAMLDAAIAENPDAEILVKTHPDVNWVRFGTRAGYFDHLQDGDRVRLIRDGVNPWCLFDLVDKVYVATSGMGLEALIAGKPVVTFGAPFYAGWGLTDDRGDVPLRARRRSLEDLFHIFYVWYTIYTVPGCAVPSRIEDALDYIEAERPTRPLPQAADLPERPALSIIIPVHNVEAYVEACLDSIAAQDFDDYEVLLVNDASEDGSQDIIDQKAARDPRLRTIRAERNLGPGFARNLALDAARGRWVLFIDPDDYMPEPGHLSRVVARAERDGADMVRYRKAFEQVENADGEVTRRRQDATERFFDREVAAARFEDVPEIAHSRHFWLWLWRRDFLEAHGLRFFTTYREERAFLVKAYLNAPRISFSDSRGVVYRIREGSAVRRAQSLADVADQCANFERVLALLHDHGAFAADSPHRGFASFQVAQFLHYLFFGFAWKTALAAGDDAAQGLCDRLGAALRATGLTAPDLSREPTQLSRAHRDASAYGLLFEALCAGRADLVSLAVNLDPIGFERLMQDFATPPGDAMAERLQAALSLYGRNASVTPAAPSVRRAGRDRPRVVLHVGATKTGSTYLQHLLDRNRPALMRKGIWYPEVGLAWQPGRPHKQAGHAVWLHAALDGDRRLRERLDATLAALPVPAHTVILSSEAFFLSSRSHELVDYLAPASVDVVCYLRRQDDWANSQYVELVAGGALNRVAEPIATWLSRPQTIRKMDYRTTLDRFADAAGADHVHPRVYDRARLAGGDLVRDFAEAAALGDALDDLPRPQEVEGNAARLSAGQVEAMRHFAARRFAGPRAYLAFAEEAARALPAWRRRQGLAAPAPHLLDLDQRREILDAVAAANEDVRRIWFPDSGILFPGTLPETGPAMDQIWPAELDLLDRIYRRWSRAQHGDGGRAAPSIAVAVPAGLADRLRRAIGLVRDYRLLRGSDLFDATWYVRTYPDVAASRLAPAWHFLRHGFREFRNPSPRFDTRRYYVENPDVAQSGANALVHYERFGRAEGRQSHRHAP